MSVYLPWYLASESNDALERGVRLLMSRLASLLDEDQFKDCEDIVRQAGIAPAAPEADPTATYSNLGRIAFEAMNPGKVFTYLPAHEMQRWEAAADAVRRATPVYAWEATTIGYKRFVTDDWYRKSSDAVRRWYKPYRCSSCLATPVPAVGASPEPVKQEEAEHAAWRADYAKVATQMLRRWPTPPADKEAP